jgi:hypothetical protein
MEKQLTHLVAVSPPVKGRSAIYQNKVLVHSHMIVKNGLVKNVFPGVDTLQKWMLKIFHDYGGNNALGTLNPTTNAYEFITYKVPNKQLKKLLFSNLARLPRISEAGSSSSV